MRAGAGGQCRVLNQCGSREVGRSGQLLDTWYFSHGADGLDVEWESELVMTPEDWGLAVPSGASLFPPSDPWPHILYILLSSLVSFFWPQTPWVI